MWRASQKQRPPVTDPERIQRRDAKLWNREFVAALACNARTMNCICTSCAPLGDCIRPLKRVKQHLDVVGRHPSCRRASAQQDKDSSDEEWDEYFYAQATVVSGLSLANDDRSISSHGQRSTWRSASTGSDFVHGVDENAEQTSLAKESSTVTAEQNEVETRFHDMLQDFFHNAEPESENPDHDHGKCAAKEGLADPNSELYKRAFQAVTENLEQSVLDFAVSFLNICAEHGCPKNCQDELLSLLKTRTLPDANNLPSNVYHAELLIQQIGLTSEVIDACPQGCVLFRKKYAHLDQCPKCHRARYKSKSSKVGLNRVRYFPLIPRLLRLYRCPSIAKLLRWAGEHKSSSGLVYHPTDSKQWKFIDEKYSRFAKELRNIRLGLLLDGVNPFGMFSSKHSMWPIMLVNYNLPPWLCITRFFVMLSILVPAPDSSDPDLAGKCPITQTNIDVYLEPLYEELDLLWKPGVPAYDAVGVNDSHHFTLRAMLIWTISDYPALGYIAGLCVNGMRGCALCGGSNPAPYSNILRKWPHLCHRRYLPMGHVYRGRAYAHLFDGQEEHRPAPERQSTSTILKAAALKKAYDDAGGPQNKGDDPYLITGVKRKSILFKLPYWKHLPVRHCVDVMHLEKNVCENLLGFLLGKKDLPKVRQDMKARGIRQHLWIPDPIIGGGASGSGHGHGRPRGFGRGSRGGDRPRGSARGRGLASSSARGHGRGRRSNPRCGRPPGMANAPKAPYSFSQAEKDLFMTRIASVKAPFQHSSNWSSRVEFNENGKHDFVNMKAHDFHVIMQKLLPVCIRGLLDKGVRDSILALSSIFQRLCTKIYDPSTFDQLWADTVMTLCELEIHFPPAFFDVMTHLIIHAVEELYWCGPVHTRWMYFGERLLGHLTRYTQNRANIAGSIAACYLRGEALGFCTEYMSGLKPYSKRVGHAQEEPFVSGEVLMGKGTPMTLSREEATQIHNFVLQSIDLLEPWRQGYAEYMKENEGEAVPPFFEWLSDKVDSFFEGNSNQHAAIDPDLFFISRQLPLYATAYRGIKAYGYHYRVLDERTSGYETYDSGISGIFPVPHEDGSDRTRDVEYVGEISNILLMPYNTASPIIVMKAKWVRPPDPSKPPSYRKDVDGNLEVNFKQLLPASVDPYVLPKSVEQVYFLHDDSPSSGWRMVIRTEARSVRQFEILQREEADC